MKVLLVWQMVPEEVKWYMVDGPSSDELAVLSTAHGQFINSTRTKPAAAAALDLISAALSKPEYAEYIEGQAKSWIGIWLGKEVPEESLPTIGLIDKIFTCGFLL
jgi:hypothetical protein